MCKKHNPRKIDKCMKECIDTLNCMCSNSHLEIVACCCGHGKYPTTIVVANGKALHWDLISGIVIPREKRFYKKDKQGYYYIPETLTGGIE